MEVVVFVRLTIGADVFLFSYATERVLFDAIPSLEGVNVTPAKIAPGESIGTRAAISCTFKDHLHKFDTDEFTAGTFWTKFRARYPTLQGETLEVLTGTPDQALADMETREYVIDSFQVSADSASVTAKDPLVFLQGKAAQAPDVNSGEIDTAIAPGDGSLTLSPAGIGDTEYTASGKLCLGGSEICSFTRVGDVCTLTARGLNLDGTGQDHDAGTKVQTVLEYSNATPSEIISDLLNNYTDVDPSWIDSTDWETQVDDYIGRLYSAQITEPTAVSKLLDELCEQVGLIIYWDDLEQQIRLKPLAPNTSAESIDTDRMLADSFSVTEQHDKRVSQVWTYYAQRDPTKKLDEVNNYRRIAIGIADNEADYNQVAIKKVFSRWIDLTKRTTAERLNDMLLARYKVPPRVLGFDLFKTGESLPDLGAHLQLSHWRLVDGQGIETPLNAQVIQARVSDDRTQYLSEEVNFDGGFDTTKYVIIDQNSFAINLRDLYDLVYSTVTAADDIVFVIESGVIVSTYWVIAGGIDPDSFPNYTALNVGSWPEGPNSLTLINNGIIAGGGAAGAGVPAVSGVQDGSDGARALYTRQAITITNNGVIAGGGGGGAATTAYAGGGGAGYSFYYLGTHAPGGVANLGSYPATPPNGVAGSLLTGGAGGGGFAGAGGDLGQAGGDSDLGTGGAPGEAVDGDSYVTFDVLGTVTGPRIN